MRAGKVAKAAAYSVGGSLVTLSGGAGLVSVALGMMIMVACHPDNVSGRAEFYAAVAQPFGWMFAGVGAISMMFALGVLGVIALSATTPKREVARR